MTLDVAALQIVQTIRSMAMEEAFSGGGVIQEEVYIYIYLPPAVHIFVVSFKDYNGISNSKVDLIIVLSVEIVNGIYHLLGHSACVCESVWV